MSFFFFFFGGVAQATAVELIKALLFVPYKKVPSWKHLETNMTMDKQPFEDVSHCDFPLPC